MNINDIKSKYALCLKIAHDILCHVIREKLASEVWCHLQLQEPDDQHNINLFPMLQQFVPFRDYMDRTGNHVLSMARLAKDVLAEIPDQLISYMKSRAIKPNPVPPPYSTTDHPDTTESLWVPPPNVPAVDAAGAQIQGKQHLFLRGKWESFRGTVSQIRLQFNKQTIGLLFELEQWDRCCGTCRWSWSVFLFFLWLLEEESAEKRPV